MRQGGIRQLLALMLLVGATSVAILTVPSAASARSKAPTKEDVAQCKDGSYSDNTNFKAWLYTIMKNTFINGHRRNKRTKALMDTVDREHDQVRLVQVPHSPEGRVRMAEIQRSLERLDPTFRTPFEMHHQGYKYNEVADHLGIPIGTVKSRIHQARQRLMEMLSDKNVPA